MRSFQTRKWHLLQNRLNIQVQIFLKKKPKSWKEEFVCVVFVWFCGVFTKCLPSCLESQSFDCGNEYSWIELLMSFSLIFVHPLRINTQCSFQRLPVPSFSGCRSSIHLCKKASLAAASFAASSLQVCSCSLCNEFQGKHLYKSGEICIPYDPLSWNPLPFSAHPISPEQF